MVSLLGKIFAVALCATNFAKADALYAVGSPADNNLYLYRLEGAASRLAVVNKLGSDPGFVIVDLERSVVLCGFPMEPTRLQIVDTRSPSTVRSVDLGYKPEETLPYGIFEVDEPRGGLYLTLALVRLWTQVTVWADHLTAVEVDNDTAKPAGLPVETLSQLSQVRFMGLVGDRFGTPDAQVPFVGENPLRLLFNPNPGASDIPAPPDWNAATADRGNPYRMLVSNDEFMVLLRGKESKSGIFDVFDKRSRSWRNFAPPFPCLFVRAFGAWLAFIGSEPAAGTRALIPGAPSNHVTVIRGGLHAGSAEARRGLAAGYRSSVQDVMEESGHNHSGKLLLWNPRTGAQFTIDTGEADSEVVYADDKAVIYRTNDVLFQSALDNGKLLPARQLASGLEVVGVHWVFVGPDAPVDQH